jgi:hypothetical protein
MCPSCSLGATDSYIAINGSRWVCGTHTIDLPIKHPNFSFDSYLADYRETVEVIESL